ncbi:MAG TPA: hypothetical protein VF039_09465 [Longimicrobiales bacterium]
MRLARHFTGLLVVFALAACGDDSSEPRIPEFDGRWEGDIQGVNFTVIATENDDGDINGTGTFSGPGGSLALSIDGVHSHPDVSFTASAAGYEDMNFSGEFDGDDTVEGRLNGSGFVNDPVILFRD